MIGEYEQENHVEYFKNMNRPKVVPFLQVGQANWDNQSQHGTYFFQINEIVKQFFTPISQLNGGKMNHGRRWKTVLT